MELTKERMAQLLSEHFPGETELLPRAAVDELVAGGEVEEIKVAGSSQVDLAGAVSVLTLALNCVKFVYEAYQDRRAAKATEMRAVIEDKYPQLLEVLGPEGLTDFLDDLRTN